MNDILHNWKDQSRLSLYLQKLIYIYSHVLDLKEQGAYDGI